MCEESYIIESGSWVDPNYLGEREENRIPRKDKNLSIKARKEGNKLYTSTEHDENKHREMLLLYSKSIVLAPNDSEELGLGYSNRSALLFHFQKTKECFRDIERALQLSESKEIRKKLALRREECAMDIRQQDEEWPYLSIEEKLLNYNLKYELPKVELSKKIPCLADCVSVEYKEKYGIYMKANRDINAGEIIGVEEGYITYPFNHQKYLVCTHCLDFVWDGIPCDKCACVIYGSKNCKDQAWQDYHDIECLILSKLNSSDYEHLEMIQNIAATRLFIKAVKKEGLEKILRDIKNIDNNRGSLQEFFENGIFSSKSFHSVYNLNYYHEDTMKTKDEVDFICPIIYNLLIRYSNIFDGSEKFADFNSIIINLLKRLISIFLANAARFQGANCICENPSVCYKSCKNNRGLILTLVSSIFKHSCVPNVGRLYSSKNKVILFTFQPIKKGEQLYISSGPLFTVDEKKKRNEILKNYFHKACDCQACIENWEINPKSTKMITTIKEANEFKNVEFAKFVDEEDVDPRTMSFKSKLYNKDTLRYCLKMVKLIYEKYDGYVAYLLCQVYKDYIESAYDMIYGIDYEIPNNTLYC